MCSRLLLLPLVVLLHGGHAFLIPQGLVTRAHVTYNRLARAVPGGTVVMAAASRSGALLLDVQDLRCTVEDTPILKGVNLRVRRGETHAIMGPNGSGKSTLSKVLVGHPSYQVTSGKVSFAGQDLLELEPQERAQQGVFLAFQYPVEIPGVSNSDFLRLATNKRRAALNQTEYDPLEFFGVLAEKMASVGMSPNFIDRDVNAGFSGGEKKRNEILQMALLEPELAILVIPSCLICCSRPWDARSIARRHRFALQRPAKLHHIAHQSSPVAYPSPRRCAFRMKRTPASISMRSRRWLKA